jgi:sulfate permease, SulP family
VWHVISSLQEVNLWTCAVGAAALAIMLLLGAFAPRVPSALVVLVLGVLSVSWFGLKQQIEDAMVES